MDRPKEAIERMRSEVFVGEESWKAVLAYLDWLEGKHVCEWPKELTREYLLRLDNYLPAQIGWPTMNFVRAVQDLAAIAPVRKKRMVDLWEHRSGDIYAQEAGWFPKPHDAMKWKGCRKSNVELEVSE